MSKPKKGVLLVNLGTPDSPRVKDVRKYLREFLSDKRVIDIPRVLRWMLVNLIIAPFRASKSAKEYKKLWTENGSPLYHYGKRVKQLLQKELGDEYLVALGMRYQNPRIQSSLEELNNENVSEITVVSLFPQYASATSGSVADKVMEIVKGWQVIPNIKFVLSYHSHPLFIKAFAEKGKKRLDEKKYDHVIFSYHGLPERQIIKAATSYCCQLKNETCSSNPAMNHYCYRSACFETSQLLALELDLSEKDYTVCFQSRLGKDPWIKPYTEDVLKELVKKNKKRILAFSPAFISDCLETTIEVGEEYKEDFIEAGGEEWDLVESLNDSSVWIKCLQELVD